MEDEFGSAADLTRANAARRSRTGWRFWSGEPRGQTGKRKSPTDARIAREKRSAGYYERQKRRDVARLGVARDPFFLKLGKWSREEGGKSRRMICLILAIEATLNAGNYRGYFTG